MNEEEVPQEEVPLRLVFLSIFNMNTRATVGSLSFFCRKRQKQSNLLLLYILRSVGVMMMRMAKPSCSSRKQAYPCPLFHGR